MSNQVANNPDAKSHQILALTGIRGYGFLAIFLGHYIGPAITQHRSNPWIKALYYVQALGWLAVPAFFVLSGYLIGGILFRSRNRDGFFRVFYGRRMLRILPVCYLTLAVVAAFDLATGVRLDWKYWMQFIYIQNLLPGYTGAVTALQLNHLWSIAIEEQFYLAWPIVVWFAKDRKTLLKVTLALCAMCWALRVASPWIHLSTDRCYFATPTRMDTILCGVALALVTDRPWYKRVAPFAKYVLLAGSVIWIVSVMIHGPANSYYRVAVEYAFGNLIVVSLIVAVMEEGSILSKICKVRWACWLGSMSYALYAYHFTYHTWFLDSLNPRLLQYLPQPFAVLATAAIALVATIALGMLSYRFIEQPALSLKKYFKYGAEHAETSRVSQGASPSPNTRSQTPSRDTYAGDLRFSPTRNIR